MWVLNFSTIQPNSREMHSATSLYRTSKPLAISWALSSSSWNTIVDMKKARAPPPAAAVVAHMTASRDWI